MIGRGAGRCGLSALDEKPSDILSPPGTEMSGGLVRSIGLIADFEQG
jgi:hypothetical protein